MKRPFHSRASRDVRPRRRSASRRRLCLAVAAAVAASAFAGPALLRNMPGVCTQPGGECDCQRKQVSANCIKVEIGLGETTPWTGSMSCALKVFADDDSPSVFTVESLYAVLGGYTFKRLGQRNMSDGATPAEVVFSHPRGEPVRFVFADGESWGRPDPGVHVKMDERLMMVDAEGWAATSNPVYYDLYVGDGTRRRFLATNATGALGKLVYVTDARGVTVTPADMGVDVVYDSNGVRQFLAPSRLANVTPTADFSGYDVVVYALQEPPAKDSATGLYALPASRPVERVSVRGENGGKRVVVTTQSGDADPQRHVFDYAAGDWSLTRPSGVEERRERYVADERAAQVVHTTVSASGAVIERTEHNYKWEPWGFAMTNRVDGFGGVTDTTEWTYYTSGNGRGQVKTERRQSGLLVQYAYDNADRVVSETRSGPGMMTEATTYSYTPVDPSDPVLPVDTRPRTVVKTLDGVECERAYYVYSPLTNIVERVGTQGAPYGGTNALRTVTAFYPVVDGDLRSGRIASVRHEDGRLDIYDYSMSSNLWTETVTHLHEQSPSPVSGKTTRDITVTNARGETIETRTEAYINGVWHVIARERRTYNAEGKVIQRENLAGQVTTTEWDCCHKISETQPDGSTTTWDYDDDGRMIASSRLIPLDMTNVTWLTTCYAYDAVGRQTATWQTNYAAQVGLPATRASYDQLGRVASRIDALGNTTTTTYSPDGRTVSVQNPNTSTRVITRSADGDTLSVTGSAVTPEFHTYGVLLDGTRWSRTVQGETASSPRFTKRYENMLGQTVREERSGFQGAVLATTHAYDSYGRLVRTSPDYEPAVEYAYDVLGNRIATTRIVGVAQSSAAEWRRTSSYSSFILLDGAIWHTQSNIVSCSDASIVPLTTSSSRQLTGLTAAIPARTVDVDIRGNATETWLSADRSRRTNLQRVPYATNVSETTVRYGDIVREVSASSVTNTYAYDALGRQTAHTGGRGNTSYTQYNAFGMRSASIDALGNRTSYAYDQFGKLAAVTNALGNAIVYEYDLRGRKTYEGGATYPVRYTYDVFGNKATMMTYRNESLGPGSGDVTTWLYDEASNCMTNKVYADGKGPTYSYTPDGRLAQRVWARGIKTDYSYDGWGNLTNTVYSDDTPTISVSYDAFGRQVEAYDAAGATTFLYDSFGSLTNETVIGVAGTNTIERYWDSFGRTGGYALNGTRQTTIGYDPATGRLLTMQVPVEDNTNNPPTPTTNSNSFTWSYLPGSDLKSSLAYPNGLAASWQYDANDQLLQVCNATPTNVISQYDYTYDAAGRRTEIARSGSAMSESRTDAYGYNDRNELISGAKLGGSQSSATEYEYLYDDIGNRITSTDLGTNRTYTANVLNQYTQISNLCDSASLHEEFTPQFDDDGNQTLIQTSTGIWQVQYNGENRPTRWERIAYNSSTPNSSTPTLISMSFDRMGRRVQYLETCGSVTNSNKVFTYDGYLQIANFDSATQNAQRFIWDPTEPVATRPLVWNFSTFQPFNTSTYYYTHDGNKNVSDLVTSSNLSVAAHYEYAPFGTMTFQFASEGLHNPLRFSSEYSDETLSLLYYNYRHLVLLIGRWLSRDIISISNLYSFVANAMYTDTLGMLRFDKSCQSNFISECQTQLDNIIEDVKRMRMHIGADRANMIKGYLLDAGFDVKGWSNQSEIGDKILRIVSILKKGSGPIVDCCPKIGVSPCDGTEDAIFLPKDVNKYNNRSKTVDEYADFRGHIIVCSASNMSKHGGCGCVLLHEVLHFMGFRTDEKEHKSGNYRKDNALIHISNELQKKYKCKGYDVK